MRLRRCDHGYLETIRCPNGCRFDKEGIKKKTVEDQNLVCVGCEKPGHVLRFCPESRSGRRRLKVLRDEGAIL